MENHEKSVTAEIGTAHLPNASVKPFPLRLYVGMVIIRSSNSCNKR
jgi:hypothetical protein